MKKEGHDEAQIDEVSGRFGMGDSLFYSD